MGGRDGPFFSPRACLPFSVLLFGSVKMGVVPSLSQCLQPQGVLQNRGQHYCVPAFCFQDYYCNFPLCCGHEITPVLVPLSSLRRNLLSLFRWVAFSSLLCPNLHPYLWWARRRRSRRNAACEISNSFGRRLDVRLHKRRFARRKRLLTPAEAADAVIRTHLPAVFADFQPTFSRRASVPVPSLLRLRCPSHLEVPLVPPCPLPANGLGGWWSLTPASGALRPCPHPLGRSGNGTLIPLASGRCMGSAASRCLTTPSTAQIFAAV